MLINHVKNDMSPFNVARLVLDLDPLAERYIVANRWSGEVLVNQRVDKNTTLCPLKYATKNDLFVVIFDDNNEYNAAIADGVRLDIVEAIAAGL